MTSKEYFQKTESLRTIPQDFDYLLKALNLMAQRHIEATRAFTEIILQGAEALRAQKTNATHQFLGSVNGQLREYSPQKIFTQVSDLKKRMNALVQGEPANCNWLFLMTREIEYFENAYDSFMKTHGVSETADVLGAGNRLLGVISLIEAFGEYTRDSLSRFSDAGVSPEEQLEVFLPSDMDYIAFVKKANALAKLYEYICTLLEVSPTQERLRIIKVESGSFWVWLSGNNQALAFVKDALEKCARYVYRNYTKEGQIVSLPRSVEAIESILNLRDKLQKRGMETKSIDELLVSASVKIVEQLEELLAGENQIEVDGSVLALNPNFQQLLGTGRQIKQLKASNDEPPREIKGT